MDKNNFTKQPPMGWNSYDYYDTAVTEDQVKANAKFMADHLKNYGWEYVVVDIQWYAWGAGSMRNKHQYIPFSRLEMDEYARLLPCPERFPSAAGGHGFRPLADYIHGLGLKFGIHIMRGIPRIAAHKHCPILGSTMTADQIADPSSICGWNPDMYGVNADEEGAGAYYDSIISMYADWGVDFIKCDDICNTNIFPHRPYSARKEIELLHRAIQKCARPIVLSLSPGPALIEEAWHYEKYANMWRITDDFWDNWKLLGNMFMRCELWQNHVSKGCYPDCDMLPLGTLGKGFADERKTRFTKEEQKTMISLWCMFRSPLMIGAELTKLDDWTLSLLTNEKVLTLLQEGRKGRQIRRNHRQVIWYSEDRLHMDDSYAALFNLEDTEAKISVSLEELGYPTETTDDSCQLEELWTGETEKPDDQSIIVSIPAHGVKLYHISKRKILG